MILIVAANFPPEPVVAANMNRDLAFSLSLSKSVVVVTPRPSRPSGFVFPEKEKVRYPFEQVILKSFICPRSSITGRLLESLSFGIKVMRFIEKNKREIECCYVHSWPFFSQMLAVTILRKLNIPAAIHIQDIYPESLTNRLPFPGKFLGALLRPADKYILSCPAIIISNSVSMTETIISTRKQEICRIKTINNWINDDDYINAARLKVSNIHNKDRCNFVFMFVGNIGPVAGVDHLIDSFNKAHINGATLVIAGSGSEKEKCMKRAAAFKNNNIEFRDVPEGTVPQIQNSADVLILPLRKGAGMSSVPSKLISYMFSAKPVIACVDDCCETALAIQKSGCGWIVPPGDTNALVLSMITAFSTPERELENKGRKGLDFAKKNYSKKINLTKLIGVIEELAI